MSGETARQAVDFLVEAGGGSSTITFFGGEPLTELSLIQDIVGYADRAYGSAVQFRMSTNGTLLDDDSLRFLSDHDIHFVLSLDGNQAQHDTHRKFADGSGSYDRILQVVPRVLQANPYTLAVSVVSPDTAPMISQGVQSLFAQGFRYVLQTLDYSAPWKDRDIRVLKEQYRELAVFYTAALIDGKKVYYSPFDERIKTWAQKPFGQGDLCDLANTQIAVAASGMVYPCVQFIGDDGPGDRVNAIGNVERGFDEERRSFFIEENYAEKESCHGCALEGRCATFCGCVNWRATGSLKTVPPIICEHERMLMPIVDDMATKLWKKNIELFRRKFYDKHFAVSSYLEDCGALRKGAGS
jgi:uncharacterized protein